MNSVALIGRLGKDAELKHVGDKGTPLLKFSIAVNDGWGEREHTSWFDCQWWGQRAEKLAQYLTKPKQIGVEGALRQETWEKDGQKRYRIVVDVRNVTLLSKSSEGGNSSAPAQEEDIPF